MVYSEILTFILQHLKEPDTVDYQKMFYAKQAYQLEKSRITVSNLQEAII